ncbi:thioredoxin domain-containing protein [Candidatus Parcubacteria bacterium]|nr:thioredoxin domain-containing protein [Patescibacteria group bacterium]MCG2693809.1 thioredoxin domain-containing protein [Candidatus Parcubacteria bacterium]
MEELTIKINKTTLFVVSALIVGLTLGYGGRFFQTKDYVKANEEVTPTEVVATGDNEQAGPTITMDTIRGLFDGNNITIGNKNSKLVFVEISDPSCPYCSIASGQNPSLNQQAGERFVLVSDGGSYLAPVTEMKKLVEQGKASFVWLYANGHNNGEVGAKALYCANEKGKFLQANDLLMSGAGYAIMNDTTLDDSAKATQIADLLKSVVDYNTMKSCLDGGKYDSKLAEDMNTAMQLGFQGTPSFFVNTMNFSGAYNYTDMEPYANAALK